MEIGKEADFGRKRGIPSYGMLLFMCCSITYACYLGSYMRIPVVPLYARSFGAGTFQIGMINSSFLLMAGALSLPLGILSDRLGRKLLILLGLLTASLTSFLLCFSTTTAQLTAVYLLFGIGLAAFAPTMMSFVADFSPKTHLGRSYGWYTLAVYCGMSMGPAVGGFMAQELGFPSVFVASGILAFVVCLVVFFFLPRARHILIDRPPKRPALVVVKELMKNRPLLACWLVTLGGCFGLGMFITFIPLHAQDQGVNIGQIGLIFTAQALFNALSRLPFGQLSDRVSKRSSLVVVGLIGFGASIALFGIATSITAFVIVAAALGVSMGIAFTAIGALISEVVPPDSRGLAMGGYNSCIYLGMMLCSLIMGAVIREIGFRNSFFIVAAINLAATAVFYIMVNFPAKASSKEAVQPEIPGCRPG